MKALTLRQPYVELMIQGKKTIEIRTWKTDFRGEFLVHSAKNIFYDDCIKFGLDTNKLDTGKIIGKVTLIDVKKYETVEEFNADFDKHKAEPRWFRKPCYGFILENPKRLDKPIPASGSLTFFDFDI
jgi:ASC-1-like (ASCH) protein